jgi:hypothetical protein
VGQSKARGVKLGGERGGHHIARYAAKGRLVSAEVRTAKAAAHAKDITPIIAEIKSAGAGLRQIARELNERGIPAAKGGEWTGVQVARLLAR